MGAPVSALTDKVAIVTGSGQGIGKAIALCFADAGANVVVAERIAKRGDNTAVEIRAWGTKALAVTADVREADQVANMIEQTLEEFGTIDILVNNAGGQFRAPFLELSEKGWDAVVRENLKSTFLCTQAVGKAMVEQKKKGSVVNIASVAGLGPNPFGSPYAAAKAGIINLTRTLSVEWGIYNIRVNAIAPGFIMTPGVAELYRNEPEIFEKRVKRIPLGRLGRPEDVAKVALFLASDAADYVTGATIPVDGGLLTLVD